MAPFRLEKAGPEDMPAFADAMYNAFPDKEVQMRYMGPDTPEQRQWNVNHYTEIMDTFKSDLWVKVVDKATDTFVAIGFWKLFPNKVHDPTEETPRKRPWLESDKQLQEKEEKLLAEVKEERKKLYTGPHLLLKILLVEPAYQRRGAGAMILEWGCALADHLFLPCWVEASEEGSRLYAKFGFVKQTEHMSSGYFMRREVQQRTVEGGK